MNIATNVFAGIAVPCCSEGDPDSPGCICGAAERVLRGYIDELPHLPSMTPAQREWCLTEIGDVEGFDRKEYEEVGDPVLARVVLDAWTSYCRDKGLY